jgi:hypothetical protein
LRPILDSDLLRLGEALCVCTAPKVRVIRLNGVVFPTANWANLEAARRLSEYKKAARGTRVGIGFHRESFRMLFTMSPVGALRQG